MKSARPVTLFHAFVNPAMERATLEVLRSGQIASGPLVADFQQALGAMLGRRHLVATNDMSSSMLIALHLAGVGPGDEVLSPAYTCMSSVAPIVNLGARPRWVDAEPDTGLMNPAALEASITHRTKACVVYHAAGYPAPMDDIGPVCRRHGIALIEDCNNALGALLGKQPVGAHADAAVYSFYPNRQVNTADGGALVLRTAEAAERALRLRRFGIAPTGFRDADGEIDPFSDIPEVGWSAAMSQLSAALGLAQMPDLRERLATTRHNAERLRESLRNLPGLRLAPITAGAEPAYWALLALVSRRDAVLSGLKRRGVLASKLHHRLDTYSGLRATSTLLPGTSTFFDRVIALPCGYWLGDNDLERIETAMEGALRDAHA